MLFEKRQCLTTAGVHQVEHGNPFRIFIANFWKCPVYLRPNPVVSKTEYHPSHIAESDISHGEVFDIVEDKMRYQNRNTDVQDIETINKHLAGTREAHAVADEKPTTADNIELKVDDGYHKEVHNMLQKHENMWTGKLGEINTTKIEYISYQVRDRSNRHRIYRGRSR